MKGCNYLDRIDVLVLGQGLADWIAGVGDYQSCSNVNHTYLDSKSITPALDSLSSSFSEFLTLTASTSPCAPFAIF